MRHPSLIYSSGRQTALAIGLLLMASLSLAAEIYRCEVEGVIVFSDRPCQARAEPYQAGHSLSISGSAEDLAETEARNQAWLEREAQRREARRAAAIAARSNPDAPESTSAARPIIGPVFSDWGLPYLNPQADRGQRARESAQRRPAERGTRQPEPAEPANARDRFSALSGRQPGSRRDP